MSAQVFPEFKRRLFGDFPRVLVCQPIVRERQRRSWWARLRRRQSLRVWREIGEPRLVCVTAEGLSLVVADGASWTFDIRRRLIDAATVRWSTLAGEPLLEADLSTVFLTAIDLTVSVPAGFVIMNVSYA